MGIATKVNGVAPPDVPLSEIDLGTWDFWGQDDDFRDGAFATLAPREADLVLGDAAGSRLRRATTQARATGH